MLHSEFTINHLQLADVDFASRSEFSSSYISTFQLWHTTATTLTTLNQDYDIMHMRYGPSLILSSTLVVSITQKVDPSRAQIFVSFYFIGGFLCLPFISSQALPAFILSRWRLDLESLLEAVALLRALLCLACVLPFLTLGNLTGWFYMGGVTEGICCISLRASFFFFIWMHTDEASPSLEP